MHTYIHTYIQTDRQTDRQIGRQADNCRPPDSNFMKNETVKDRGGLIMKFIFSKRVEKTPSLLIAFVNQRRFAAVRITSLYLKPIFIHIQFYIHFPWLCEANLMVE